MESIYTVGTCTGTLLSFTNIFLNLKELDSFIDSIDGLLNGSKFKLIHSDFKALGYVIINEIHTKLGSTSKEIYRKTNQTVEKYTEIGIFAIKNVVVPCFVLPKAIVRFFIYFTTDVGNDAFDLPIGIW